MPIVLKTITWWRVGSPAIGSSGRGNQPFNEYWLDGMFRWGHWTSAQNMSPTATTSPLLATLPQLYIYTETERPPETATIGLLRRHFVNRTKLSLYWEKENRTPIHPPNSRNRFVWNHLNHAVCTHVSIFHWTPWLWKYFKLNRATPHESPKNIIYNLKKTHFSVFSGTTQKNVGILFFIGETNFETIPSAQHTEPLCVEPSRSCGMHSLSGLQFNPHDCGDTTSSTGGHRAKEQQFGPIANAHR